MRIGIVQSAPWHPERDPGSLETLMTALSAAAALEHEVVLYAPLYGPHAQTEDWSLESERFTRLAVPAGALAARLASADHDVVSVHNLPGAAAYLKSPMALFLHGCVKPETGWPGKIPGHPSPLDLTWDETLNAINQATRLAAPSNFAATSIASVHKTATPDDVDIVHPIVRQEYVANVHDHTTRRVAWIGRPVRSKGLPYMVENAARWQFEWSWSASGFFGDLEQSFLNDIPNPLPACNARSEMLAFYASTKVVLCPYRNEGFGMVATEAAAAGCRVVGFADGGLLETAVVPHIRLVPPGDVDSFNRAVLESLDAGPVCASDREAVYSAFSPAVAGAAYLEHLHRAAGVHIAPPSPTDHIAR